MHKHKHDISLDAAHKRKLQRSYNLGSWWTDKSGNISHIPGYAFRRTWRGRWAIDVCGRVQNTSWSLRDIYTGTGSSGLASNRDVAPPATGHRGHFHWHLTTSALAIIPFILVDQSTWHRSNQSLYVLRDYTPLPPSFLLLSLSAHRRGGAVGIAKPVDSWNADWSQSTGGARSQTFFYRSTSF